MRIENKEREKLLSILFIVYIFASIVFFNYWMEWRLSEVIENPPPEFSEERYQLSLEEFITDLLTTIGAVILFSLIFCISYCLAFYLYEKIKEKRRLRDEKRD